VQDGFDQLRRRFPRSDSVLNTYAKLACVAGDGEKYHALRPLAAAHPSSRAWSEKRSMPSCDKLFDEASRRP
jgi:hypothetical protein